MSPEQRAALDQRYGLITGYFRNLPGVDQNDPWGGAGSYFAKSFNQANPYSLGPSGRFSNPILDQTTQFYADELGRIQPPKTNYTATGNNYTPVDLSEASQAFAESSGGPVAKESVARTSSDAAIAAAKNIMDQIITPGVRAQLASSGMGRTGAEAEVTSQRGAELALPIASQWQGEQARANELEASLGQQANNLSAQLKSNMAQVQFLERSKASLQAQALQARDQSEVREINARMAQVDAQLAQATQQTRAIMAAKGVDMGLGLVDRSTAYDMTKDQQERQFMLDLLRGTPMPGGGTVTNTGSSSSSGSTSETGSTTNTGSQSTSTPNPPSRLANDLMNLAALLGLAGGGQLVQKALAAGVGSVKDFAQWLTTPAGGSVDPQFISSGMGASGSPEDPFAGFNNTFDNFNPIVDSGVPEGPGIAGLPLDSGPDWWDVF